MAAPHRTGPVSCWIQVHMYPHTGHDHSFPATATATKLTKVPSQRTRCQTPPLCPAQPLHQECDPEDARRLNIGPRGGRVSNRSLSTALGLCVCCRGKTEELLVPKEPPALSCP